MFAFAIIFRKMGKMLEFVSTLASSLPPIHKTGWVEFFAPSLCRILPMQTIQYNLHFVLKPATEGLFRFQVELDYSLLSENNVILVGHNFNQIGLAEDGNKRYGFFSLRLYNANPPARKQDVFSTIFGDDHQATIKEGTLLGRFFYQKVN